MLALFFLLHRSMNIISSKSCSINTIGNAQIMLKKTVLFITFRLSLFLIYKKYSGFLYSLLRLAKTFATIGLKVYSILRAPLGHFLTHLKHRIHWPLSILKVFLSIADIGQSLAHIPHLLQSCGFTSGVFETKVPLL